MADMRIQTSFDIEPPIGYAGQLGATSAPNIMSLKNVDSVSIPFGYAVIFDRAAPASDYSATLPAAETDIVAGIVIRSHAYEHDDGLDSTGVEAGHFMNVLRKGRVLVVAEDAVAVGDPLWVRCTAGGAGEVVGGLTNADDGTETIDCSAYGKWLTSASAGELAWLEVNF